MIDTRVSRGFVFFTLGALTGAAIAYLTAPRTGSESREALLSWGRNLRWKTKTIPSGIREAVERGRQETPSSYTTSYQPEIPGNKR